MEELVIGKYPADSFCLWDGDELIARTAIFIFDSPEDMLLQLKIALIAYKRGNHLPYLYVNTGIKLLLKQIKLNMKINNRLPNMYGGYLHLINMLYRYNNNIGISIYKYFISIIYWPSDGGGKQYSRIDETILNLIEII